MSEWISVKDRLPDEEQWVLVYIKDPGDVRIALFRIDERAERDRENYWLTWRSIDLDFSEITHWQPLPPPPKEEE